MTSSAGTSSPATPTAGLVSRALAWLGLDFHIGMTVLMRSWTAVAGLANVLLLSLALSRQQQGYYYTFATLTALQVFFELGLNQVIVQVVSRESASSRVAADGSLSGDIVGAERIAAFAGLMRRWYRLASAGFILVVGALGILLFRREGDLPTHQWLLPWAALVIATGINLRLSPFLALSEGLGHVGQVARLRLWMSLAGYVVMWVLLVSGAGLWSAVAIPWVTSLMSARWLRRRFQHRPGAGEGAKISWRREIFPFQWRVSVSWISGYFIFSFFTPVIFARFGAGEAGRIGMALTILTAVTTISLSWVNAKVPTFAALVKRGERDSLNSLFRSVTVRSTLAVVVICAVMLVGVWTARVVGIGVAERIAPPHQLVWMCIATITNVMTFALASYMRAHFEEPMLTQSVVIAVLVATATLLAPSTTATFAAYAGIVVLIGIPWTALLFRRYYTGAKSSQTSTAG